MTVLIAVIGLAILVGVSVWVWVRHRGVAFDQAAQVLVEFLRSLFGG